MADVNRGNRPISPHLTIYRLPLSAKISIFHRITGTGLAVTAILVVWWFLSGATSSGYYALVDGLLTSWIGGLILILSAWALWFHFCNGVRHLIWDVGRGFELEDVDKSSLVVLGASAVLTLITIIIA